MIILPIHSGNSAPTAYTVNICTIRLKMFVLSLIYGNAAVCRFCAVRWIIIIVICFSLLLSNYSTYFFATFFLCFVFLFCMLVFYLVYPVFLYCFVYFFSFVYSCLFPIFVQVYRPLPLGGNPMQ